jgi:hypothetical protein
MRRRVRRFTCSSVPPRQPQGVTGTRPVTGDRSGVRHRAAAYLAMAFHGSRRIDECGRPLAAHEARHRAWPDPDRFGVRDSGAGVVCQHRCLSDSVTAGPEPLPPTRQAFDFAWGTPSGVEGMKVQGAGAHSCKNANLQFDERAVKQQVFPADANRRVDVQLPPSAHGRAFCRRPLLPPSSVRDGAREQLHWNRLTMSRNHAARSVSEKHATRSWSSFRKTGSRTSAWRPIPATANRLPHIRPAHA